MTEVEIILLASQSILSQQDNNVNLAQKEDL